MSAKLAIPTEGEGEYASLDRLYPKIHRSTAAQLLSPIKVAITPDAPPRRIAHACAAPLKLSAGRGAEGAVLPLDRENAVEPATTIEVRIQTEVDRLDILNTLVVLKDRMYENWLVADIDAMARLAARFAVTPAMKRMVVPGKADQCDALGLLKRAAIKRPYHKIQDAKRICSEMQIEKAAGNSRSFRRFLKVVGHRSYAVQGEYPAGSGRARRSDA